MLYGCGKTQFPRLVLLQRVLCWYFPQLLDRFSRRPHVVSVGQYGLRAMDSLPREDPHSLCVSPCNTPLKVARLDAVHLVLGISLWLHDPSFQKYIVVIIIIYYYVVLFIIIYYYLL